MADCGLPDPSLVTTRDAGLEPAEVGANARLTVQDPPGVKDDGQLFPVMLYWAGLVPPNAIDEIATAVLPVDVITIPCAALVVPVFWVPNVRLSGLRLRVLVGI